MRNRNKLSLPARYPCGNCRKNCGLFSIQCENCETWYHYKCELLTKNQYETINNSPYDFFCRTCCRKSDGSYNYDLALDRLTASSKSGDVFDGAKIEKIFFRNEIPRTHYTKDILFDREAGLKSDPISVNILGKYGGPADKIPVSTSPDGNCLFNSLSVALCGNESLASELRVRTCIEMVENEQSYLELHKYDRFELVEDSYARSCLGCGTNCHSVGIYSIHAAATVIGVPIRTIFPPVNGLIDPCPSILSKVLCPLGKKSSKSPVYVMWTSTYRTSAEGGTWNPNHFVPLLQRKHNITINISDTFAYDEGFPKLPTPGNFKPFSALTSTPKLSKSRRSLFQSTSKPVSPVSELSGPKVSENGNGVERGCRDDSIFKRTLANIKKEKLSPLAKKLRTDECKDIFDTSSNLESSVQYFRRLSDIQEDRSLEKTPEVKLGQSKIEGDSSDSLEKFDVGGDVSGAIWDEKRDNISSESPGGLSMNEHQRDSFSSLSELDVGGGVRGGVGGDVRGGTGEGPGGVSMNENQRDSFITLSESDVGGDVGDERGSNISEDSGKHPFSNPTLNSLNGKFLSINDTYEKIAENNAEHKFIPRGKKENVFFFLDNSANVTRRQKGEYSDFTDDCGSWNTKTTSTKTYEFIMTTFGKITYVTKRNGQYCRIVKKEHVPLDPQPDPNEIFVLKRYYATLERDSNYKKRISWFEKMPGQSEEKLNLAIAEYIGTFPSEKCIHRNSKNNRNEFVRTSPKTKEIIKKEIKTGKTARQIYQQARLNGSLHAPRDLRQVQNVKAYTKKQEEPKNCNKKNNADDIQNLLTAMASQEPKFIRKIVQLEGKPPNIVCYTDEQFQDLMNSCASGRSVLGVDRTFNLGACYVTCTVFQNFNLLRKGKCNAPIMLGPIYLHWDGGFETYYEFFSHLKCKFLTIGQNFDFAELGTDSLIVGSDEEKALVKAVVSNFPDSKLILCVRHLEQNMKRHLKDRVGLSEIEEKRVIESIFGKDGLLHSDSSFEFEKKSTEIERKFGERVGPYLTNKMIPALRENVFKVQAKSKFVPMDWKNNNCEAMNHILKLNSNWQPCRLPDLVEKIFKETQFQYRNVRAALHGHGDYELAPRARKFVVPDMIWRTKSETEKQKQLDKFLRFRPFVETNDRCITSTDGLLKVPKTPQVARKPGQKKRIRNAKTLTLKKNKAC